MLIVDQFERIFTLNPGDEGEAERQAFITALCAAASPASMVGVPSALIVIALRGDFWEGCAARPELADALQAGQFVVGPMTESDLRLAITGPAGLAGLQIDTVLVDTIVGDLRAARTEHSAGVLPLLSQAMLLTWENREGTQLTSRGYAQAGGVDRAVQVSADTAYDSFTSSQQILARELLRGLTVVSRDGRLSRRPVSRAALDNGRTDAERYQLDVVLEAFATQRLIVLSDGAAEIAHDALLHAWPRLQGWLEEDRTSWMFYSQVTEDAAAWQDHGNDTSFLYRGTQLATLQQAVKNWATDPRSYPAITGIQRDFLQTSARAAARSTRQRQILATVMVVLLIASLVGAGIAVRAARNANEQSGIAEQQRDAAVSGQLAADSEQFDGSDPATASLLAAAAWQISPTALAQESLLDVLAQPERGVFPVSAAVGSLAFSPGGKILVTGDFNGQARMWNVADQRLIAPPLQAATGSDAEVPSVAFSPDGRTLATATNSGAILLWDVTTHRQIGGPLDAGSLLPGGVSALAFNPDGRMLIAISGDGMVRSWNVASHRQVGAPLAVAASGGSLEAAFSPDGKILAVSHDGQVQLWDLATRRQMGTLPTTDVVALAFSPSGKTLATGRLNGLIQLWDSTTQRPLGVPMNAGPQVITQDAVAFSPDGSTLATAAVGGDSSDSGTVRLWNVATQQQAGAPVITSSCDGGVLAVTFSPATNLLATAGCDGTVRLWDVALDHQSGAYITAGPIVGSRQQQVLAFSPDSKMLITTGQQARLWDVATHSMAGAFSPVKIRLSARERAELRAVSRVPGDPAVSLAFSAGEKTMATVSLHGWVRLWNVARRRQLGAAVFLGTPDLGAGNVQAAYSPDGEILATVSGPDATARLWHVAPSSHAGSPLVADAELQNGVASAMFSPSGRTLVTGSFNGKFQFWNVVTHRPIGTALIGQPDAFSPDGKIIAASEDNAIQLWDVVTHRPIGTALTADNQAVDSAAFNPDGTILAVASDNGEIRFWDVSTHSEIGSPLPSNESFPINSVPFMEFSPDGKLLATAYDNGSVILWNVTLPRDYLSTACAIAGKSLTHQQWNTYIPLQPFHQVCLSH